MHFSPSFQILGTSFFFGEANYYFEVMAPNKNWMNLEDHLCEDYEKGVESFLDYACTKLGTESIRCPCTKCVSIEFGNRELVHGHLLAYEIVKRYTFWYHHGETLSEPSDEMNDNDDFDDDDDDDDDVDEM